VGGAGRQLDADSRLCAGVGQQIAARPRTRTHTRVEEAALVQSVWGAQHCHRPLKQVAAVAEKGSQSGGPAQYLLVHLAACRCGITAPLLATPTRNRKSALYLSSTRPAEKPSTGFLVRSARRGRMGCASKWWGREANCRPAATSTRPAGAAPALPQQVPPSLPALPQQVPPSLGTARTGLGLFAQLRVALPK